eukprot:1367145-Amphidinium_carterae.1
MLLGLDCECCGSGGSLYGSCNLLLLVYQRGLVYNVAKLLVLILLLKSGVGTGAGETEAATTDGKPAAHGPQTRRACRHGPLASRDLEEVAPLQ